MDKEASFKLLDAYYDACGNFIDIANDTFSQDGSSELYIGEWAEKRGIRDRLLLTTKYTNDYMVRDPNVPDHKIFYGGNSAKSLHLFFQASLKKLRTDYIEEVMHALHALVLQGKVLYLGISDTPAWVVAKVNAYARANSLTPFVIYQGHWNLTERSFEREIIPVARSEGMALAPWNVLASGKFRSDAEEAHRLASGECGRTLMSSEWLRNNQEKRVFAIAHLMHKAPFVFPIVGGRKVEHLHANLEALEISLSDEQIIYLESVVPFDPGFPNNMIGDGSAYRNVWTASGHINEMPLVLPISHRSRADHKRS
ncbi:NADP-dependent oxidoreductase domain-containing protein [Panaeolus papilionaceus]|nr:NADP-dependent oxidoreductase domain-containing protein [Panaeolus papilionaceus]